ncbi:RTA-like protein [Lasiodiplodia theobromae]|nr:RTA-like protein [Lasiodiplodia theobromae]
MPRYGSGTSWACYGLFDDEYSRAFVAVEALEIVSLIILLVMWARAQGRTPNQFEVLKWHNFGITLHFWLLYIIIIFIEFFMMGCADSFTIVDAYRMSIVAQVFFWIAKNFLLATVLLAIPRGLDRLRDPADIGRSTWYNAAGCLQAFIALFTVVFLALFIWAYQSAIDNYNRPYSRGSFSAFPQYIYVYMAITTCWFVVAVVAASRIAYALSAATSRWRTVPGGLKGWGWTLCGSLFAYGVVITFFAFFDVFGVTSRSVLSHAFMAQRIAELVLTTFFSLLLLLSVMQVAKGISQMLAHPDSYGFGRERREADDAYVGGQNHHGVYGEDSAYFETHNRGYYGSTVR